MTSEERLVHMQCVKCGGWWTIGDAPFGIYYCPWCGEIGVNYEG